ncbi:Uncharacterized protein SCF082_LOCUS37453 [Durusdinium trenchii]|uniref:Uncharacterized protein n=1 Tax=Durusdinium trenchii TaxID=1381693 RepID=A0ABP0PQG9_9DINO
MMRIAWSRLRKPQDAEGLQVSAKFHEALVNLMKTGCRLMALALFLRLIAIQGPLLMQKEHQLQPSLDISNMISYPLCCLIVLCPKVLTPRTLDSWYLVMQTLCVFPLLFTEPQDVVNVSLITAFPRMLCGIGARTCFLPILGNLVNCGVAIYQAQEDADGGGGAGGLAQTAELCMVLCGILSMRQGLYENVLMNTRLKSRSIDLEAVSQLLLGFCDAVVEIDGSLKLTEDSRQLSTLLLHNQGEGMTGEGLAGRDFLSFFCQEEPSFGRGKRGKSG